MVTKTIGLTAGAGIDYVAPSTSAQNTIHTAMASMASQITPTNPGIIHLKPGTYNLSNQLVIPANIILEGEGDTSILRAQAGFPKSWYFAIIRVAGSNSKLRSFAFDGNRMQNCCGGDGNSEGIQLSGGTTNTEVRDLYIYEVTNDALQLGSSYCTVENIRIKGTWHAGIMLSGNHTTINNIKIDGVGNAGFRFLGAVSDVEITNVEVTNVQNWAFEIYCSSDSDRAERIRVENFKYTVGNYGGISAISIVDAGIHNKVRINDINFKNVIIDQKGTGTYDNDPGVNLYYTIGIINASNVTFDKLSLYNAAPNGSAIVARNLNPQTAKVTIKNSILQLGRRYGIENLGGITWDIHHNDIFGFSSGNTNGISMGTGNISQNPLFISPATGDFRLQPTSPCRGSGENGINMGANPDLFGNPSSIIGNGTFDSTLAPWIFDANGGVGNASAANGTAVINVGTPVNSFLGTRFYVSGLSLKPSTAYYLRFDVKSNNSAPAEVYLTDPTSSIHILPGGTPDPRDYNTTTSFVTEQRSFTTPANVPKCTLRFKFINAGLFTLDNISIVEQNASPVPTGILDVSSTPPGAEITIDNQDQGKVTRSIIQNIPIGSHSLKLTLARYRDYTTTFVITGARTTTLNPTLTPVQPRTGVLDVSSTPLGAEIFINNQDQGKVTRSIIQNIPIGTNSLKLTLPGYQDYTTTFVITGAWKTILKPTLTPVTPPIACSISGCPPSIIQGQTMYIQPSFSGGLAPYLVQPLRDGVPYGNPISAPNTNIGQIVIPIDSSWTVGDHLVSFKITDSSSPQASCTTVACTISVTSSVHFVTTIEIFVSSLFTGETALIPRVCKDQYNAIMTCPKLYWVSSAPTIAKVDQTGRVTAIAVGTATITAYGGGNVEGHKTITIHVR